MSQQRKRPRKKELTSVSALDNHATHASRKLALETPQLLWTISQAMVALNLSRTTLWRIIRRSEIRTIGRGRGTRIPVREGERWIADQLGETA
jgi:hypothetical protein